ncbi:hypothetical protein Cni_G02260 [Canna indica]|uniref:Uncharacterized protein n=1 Tax=Canna indica TaxID=4628 RepID=A0AAQ3JS64_9LILI|nr:hypothetical protein Cni_G02260 [Canna indica]
MPSDSPTPPGSPLRQQKKVRNVDEGPSPQTVVLLVGGVTTVSAVVTGNRPLVPLQPVAPFKSGKDVHIGANVEFPEGVNPSNFINPIFLEVESQFVIAKVELVKLYQDLAKAIAENSRLQAEVPLAGEKTGKGWWSRCSAIACPLMAFWLTYLKAVSQNRIRWFSLRSRLPHIDLITVTHQRTTKAPVVDNQE